MTPLRPGNPALGYRFWLAMVTLPGADVMRERSTKDSSFPHWVALGSLVFVLALFFSNTVPALRERQGLRELQIKLVDLRQQYEQAIEQTGRQARLGQGPNARLDLQSLLVAIDQQGTTPLELWQRYQEPAAGPQRPEASNREQPDAHEPR